MCPECYQVNAMFHYTMITITLIGVGIFVIALLIKVLSN